MSIQESWWIDLAPDNHAHCLQVIYASRSDINKSHDDHHQNWRFNKVAIKILPTSMKRCIMLGGFCLSVSLMMWIMYTVGQYVEYVENSVWNWQSQFSVSWEHSSYKKERGNEKRFGSTLFKPFKRVITHKWSPGSENSASVFFY